MKKLYTGLVWLQRSILCSLAQQHANGTLHAMFWGSKAAKKLNAGSKQWGDSLGFRSVKLSKHYLSVTSTQQELVMTQQGVSTVSGRKPDVETNGRAVGVSVQKFLSIVFFGPHYWTHMISHCVWSYRNCTYLSAVIINWADCHLVVILCSSLCSRSLLFMFNINVAFGMFTVLYSGGKVNTWKTCL